GRDRRDGGLRAGDPGRLARRDGRPGHAGGAGPGHAAREAGGTGAGARRAGQRPPPVVADDAPGPCRLPGRADRPAERGDGRTALADQYRRLVVRRGKKKAAIAVGHRMLTLAYHLLRRQEDYREPAPADLDERRRAQARLRAVNQLRQLGSAVTLTPREAAA